MIHTASAVRILQAVAITVGIAVFLWSTGLPTIFHQVEAAGISSASDTLSNSAPSEGSVHTIAFTTANGLSIGQTIVLSFEAGFDLTGLDGSDISMTVDGSPTTTQEGASGVGAWGVATGTPGAQDVQLTTPTDIGVSSSSVISITIGSSTNTMIVNPSATSSYSVDIGGTMQDSGQVRVAVLEYVTVSASVDTTLTFTVSGVQNGGAVNGTSTTGTSTITTLPFGTLTAGSISTLAQRLNVTTNALNGYSVTVEQSQELQSTTGGIIDNFVDGSSTTTPTAWVSPSGNVNDVTTYGHWGITSTDGTTTRSSEFSSNQWIGPSTTPIVIMGHTGPADGTTEGVGSSTVGYQIEITALQEAGDDYSTQLRYIATPTF